MTWVGIGNLHRYRVMFLCTYDWVSLLMVVLYIVVESSIRGLLLRGEYWCWRARVNLENCVD
jgi:hypothetical protein